MKILPTKGRGHFMSIVLTLLLFTGNRLFATPECPIVTARFSAVDGTTVDNSATGWYLDASRVASTGYFAVKSNRLHAQELGGEGIWYSKVFSTAGYTDWQVAVKVSSEGDMNSTEYVKIYYKINGGSEVLLDQRTGNFGTIDFTSPVLNGNNVQLVVKIYNYNNGGSQTSKYYIEEYRVFKDKGPCASTGITVTATAGNSGVLTCTNPSLTLSASSTASSVTYSWTGPNGFTSTQQNPTVSTAGTYTVTATNSSGSGTATVTVTENKTPPDLSATGGSLACGSSVTLNANSSVANVTYSWTGPNNFTSTVKNPTVSTAGNYTVTVRNPANGCTASQTVSVTTAATTNTWVEDFALSNGTTSDNGTTSWTTSTPSGSTFAVTSNELRASGIGTSSNGVWTSSSISISGKTNVSISIDTRSSGVEMNTSGTYMDYIRFYYKLNGGSEVLFAEKLGNINNHSTTNTNVSVTGLSGTSLQIIVKARATGTDEFYYFDNVKVTAVDPAVTLATAVSGPVTCTSNAVITVTPSGTVSSWAWTGPNGFTSTTQNPTVTAGGQYNVTGTLPSGCTVSASVNVTENKTPPDVTATGGALGCLTSVTINATSSVSGVTYSWTGPNNFSSTSQSPSVNTAGTYTVTVRNPANGCTNTQSVQVAAGNATPTAFWWEDFTLANGTTVDNGATSWTLTNSGAGTISVQNNEFAVSYNTAAEAVWTSAVVDISGKSSVVISAYLRSETASTNDAFESDDYMRVYYKLNGGAEVLIYDDAAGIGSTTTGTASTTVSSAALSGSTLQVIIKARNSDKTERYYFDDVKLTGANSSSNITATASVTDSLTCTRTSVTLSGSSNVTGATYRWTGPNSFTSTTQNPAVTAAGTYTLTVTDPTGGCTATATVTVVRNITAPNISASVNGSLSCGASTVTLLGSSSTAGVTYGWTGPNSFSSTAQNPQVSVAGDYILTVTNPTTGCTAKDTVTVAISATTASFWLEDFTLANGTTSDNGATSWTTQTPSGSTFAVNSNEFKISGQGTTGESVWTSGVINITGKTGLGLSANVRSAITGSAVMNDTGEYADYIRFYYKLNGGAEVLFAEKRSAINNHSTTYSNISLSSLSTGTSLQLVIRARATGTDEFYYVDNVKVTGVDAAASVSGPLSCKASSVTLSGSSNTAGVTYSWTGPNNFTSTDQNPVVTVAGTYTLTVTAPGGCTATSTVTVSQNITKPNLTVTQPAALTCTKTSVSLTAATTTTGTTITWTGFTAGQNPVTVTAPGKYYVTVKDTANGCTSMDSVTVVSNGTPPNVSASVNGSLSCGAATVTLLGSSSTAGVTYGWTGPNNFTSTAQNPQVSVAGDYILTVTNPTNGCTAKDTTTVSISTNTASFWLEDFTLANGATSDNGVTSWTTQTPSGSTFAVNNNEFKISGQGTTGESVWTSGVINITGKTSLGLSANVRSAITGGAVMNETGEYADYIRFYYKLNGGAEVLFAEKKSAINNHSTTYSNISMTGLSTGTSLQLVIRARATGTDEFYYVDNVKVTGVDAAAGVSGPLSCKATSVTLSGNSNTTGVTYSWTGPNNFTSTDQNPVVTVAGTYTLTVTAPGGCTATSTVTVSQNITKPNLTVTPPAVLTCTTTSVSLAAATTTTGTTITWTGFTAGQNPVAVTAPGKYYVTVKDTANGCTSMDSVTVTQDAVQPNLTIAQPPVLTCGTTSVNLTASSTTNGVTFTWTGFTAGQNPVAVTAPGTYTVTAKTANGCTSTASVTVTQSVVKPNLTVTQPAVLTCTTTSVNLTAATTTSGAIITWTGFAAGQNPVSVTAPGKYYATTTGTNGCIQKDSVTVTQDAAKPNLTVTQPAVLNCTTTSVNLTAASATNGATITWTGFAAGQNPVSVTAPGKYYVTATSGNGCTQKDSVTVTQDVVLPNLTVTQPAVLTCTTTSVNLTAASTTTGVTFTWTGFAAGQNPVSVTAPGTYTVTAKAANGCTSTASVTVTQNIAKPNLTVVQPAVLNCTTTSVNLTAATTTTGATITWTGFAAGQNPVSITAPGKYYVTATGSNGCIQKDSVTVTQDIAKPNLTVAQPGVLTCNVNYVDLTASTTSDAIITWTGYPANQDQISVVAPGKYYVVATGTNGCTQKDSVTVTQDVVQPNLTVTPPAVLTCTTTSVNLTAASTTTGVTFTWTGFAAGQNPVSVTAPGTYALTATAPNGCATTANVTVTQNITKPSLRITQPAVLNCTTTSVSLVATTNGTSITWTGFAAGQNPVSVTAPGKYYAVATGTNGCTQKDSVTVTQDITKPNLTVTQPAVLNCTTTSVNLTAASTTNGVTITWTGFAAGQNPVSVTAPGTYTVTATTANGCSTTASVTVTQDNAKPNLTVTQPAVLTCATTSVNLTAATTTTGATITWTGFAAGQNPVSVTTPGTYTATATTANGCSTTASVTVTQDVVQPNLTVTQPAVLTCTTTSVNLTAATITTGATINWTGFAAGQNPVSVTTPGTYTATATTANGCSTTASVTVTQDNAKPNLTVTQPAVLTCTTTSVNLTAASTTNGVTITWTGFAAGQNPVSVTAPGTYTATATTANGCSTTASVTVTQDNAKPNLTVTQPAVLTCATTSVNLTAATTTTGATITWAGFAAGQNPVSVTAPGTYTATATTANGCSTTASVTVTQNIVKPNLTVTQPAVLNCTTTSVNLTAATTTTGATITWTGFAAGQNPVSVTTLGKYYAVATSSNGCTQKDSVTVTQDITKPNLTVSQPAVLNCTTTSINLTAATTTTGATITWTGFAAGQNPVSVTAPGTYTATATTANGCSTTASVTVTQDNAKPNVTVTQPPVLTCSTTSVNLTAASTTNGVTITWTGFTAGQNPIAVTTPGTYIVTATTANGCSSTTSVTVTQDITKPNLAITQPAVLTCATTSVSLTAITNGTSITWTGFAAGQNPVSVTTPGKYYAVATASNGCTQKDSVTVTQDITKPTLAITQPAVLTCTTTAVNLTATTNGTSITWTGFAAGQNPVSVTTPGKYYAVATGSNGCTQKDSVTVTQDITKPNLTVTQPAVLTCATTSVSLTATTNGTTITWTGFAAGQNPVSVTTPGKYYAVATSSNGCTQKDSVTVTQDITKPNLTVTQPPVLTCSTTSVNLTAASTTNGVTITWTGFAAGQNPVSVTTPGTYTATATTANGCSTTASVTVTQDNAKPNLTVTQPPVLTCSTTSVNLTAASTTNGVTITWTGFAAGQNPVSVTAPGTYTATATTANGCSTTASVTVTQDITKPNLTVTQPPVLTCSTTSVNLTAASTTNGVTITWTGFAAGQNPVSVTAPGTYTATATTANGCSTTASVTVTQDITKPTLAITQPAVLTCATTSVNLAATTNGTTITWTGFAAGQNPVSVTAPGKYYAIATAANGCTQKDSVTVTQDITKPNLTVTQPAVLTCNTTSVNLTATTNGTSITWTGFAAGQNPVSVTTPGKYYAVATGSNGCTQKDSVTVTQNITKPTLAITQPAVLTCNTTSVNLTATTNGTSITWTGFAAGQNPVSVTTPGKYYAVATSANGCTQKDSVTVTQDITKPNLSITQPAVLTCATTSVSLTATTNGTTITWTGFAAGQNPVSVTAPGKYYAIATASNGCTQKDSVTVTQDITKPNLSITQPAVLTCATTSVNLTASTNGTTITWTGFAAGQNPVSVTTPGKYYAVATSANGCTQKDSVTVTQDITKPNLSITQPAVLTCTTTAVNLTATTNGTTITWTGFAAGQNPISVTAPGKYYAIATAANGCTQKDSVTVTQDITKPTLAITQPAVLTCATTSVNLTATTNGTTITWTGFAAGQNPISVTAPGKYYAVATAANGCTQKDSVTVTQDITKPTLAITQPAVLTCATTSVNLTATTNGTTITWTGFAAGQNPVSVTAPGKYYAVATGSNGCTQKDSVTVTQDITKPNLSIIQPAVLTCNTTSVNLTASTNGTTITWTGFAAGQNPVSVTTPGKYYAVATAANGCTQKDSVTVTQDIVKPNLSITPPAVLNCTNTSINLNAGTSTSNTTITWTGFTAGQNPVSVITPGKYIVTIKNNVNGCTNKDSVTVTQDLAAPQGVDASNNGPLTCARTSVTLTGVTSSSNVTYRWTNATNTYNATTATAFTNVAGIYTLTVTNTATGCTSTKSTQVTQNNTAPGGLVTGNDGPLTCTKTSVTLTGGSSTAGVTYRWTDGSGFDVPGSTAVTTKAGTYTLTVTDPGNSCTATKSTIVAENKTIPQCVINTPAAPPDALSFNVLTANDVTNVAYAWTLTATDPQWSIVSGADASSVVYMSGNANTSGTFKLVVTDKTNGCQNTASLTLRTAAGATLVTAPAKTASTAAVEEPAFEYKAYPNPFVDRACITFKSPVSGRVEVAIYGTSGNRETVLFSSDAQAGLTYKLFLDAQGIPPGIHYCVIRANGKIYSAKLILAKW